MRLSRAEPRAEDLFRGRGAVKNRRARRHFGLPRPAPCLGREARPRCPTRPPVVRAGRAAAAPENGPVRTVTFARAFRGDAEDGVGAKRLSSTGELFLPATVLGDFPPQRTWPWWPPVSSELLPDRSADFLLPGTSPTGWRGEHGESLRQRAARTTEASRRPGCSPGRECRAPPRGGFVVLQSGPLLPRARASGPN